MIVTEQSCRISYRGEMRNDNDLATWLITECEKRNLSWAEASRRANISPNTISDAVNGTSIGHKRLLALAEFFGRAPEDVFRMAGLLPPLPSSNNGLPPEIVAATLEIQEIWRRVYRMDPEAARELMMIAKIQGDAFEVAVNAALRRLEKEEQNH